MSEQESVQKDRAKTGTWSLRPSGVGTVVQLELGQKFRSKRWYIAFALWFVFHVGMAVLSFSAVFALNDGYTRQEIVRASSSSVFTLSTIVTVCGLLVVLPGAGSASINGDRSAGTLATLQASLLSPLEIVAGKILAGWVMGLVLIGLASPTFVTVGLLSGAGVVYVVRLLAALVCLALCVVGVCVGFSALTNRPLGSIVLSYLTVLTATFVLPLVYGMTLPLLSSEEQITRYTEVPAGAQADEWDDQAGGWDALPDELDEESYTCVPVTERSTVYRTDLTLPLLMVNPVVMVADSVPAGAWPAMGAEPDGEAGRYDGLQAIRDGVRHLQNPDAQRVMNDCFTSDDSAADEAVTRQVHARFAVWPVGFGLWFAGAVAATAVAVRRLRTPIRRLPKGQRIA